MASIRARLIINLIRLSGRIPWTAKPRATGLPAQGAPPPEWVDRFVARRRARVERLASLNPPPWGTRHEAADVEGLPAEWVWGPGCIHGRAVLYLHGGGYSAGSVRSHLGLAARISRAARAPALLPAYRLAPEHRFPAALEDALRAYRWLLARGLPADRIAVAGDSAGGGLAVAAMLAMKEMGLPLPAAGVCLSPWFDLAMTGRSIEANRDKDPVLQPMDLAFMARNYLGPADPKTPTASPLYGDLGGLPPLLIQVGRDELLRDDAVRLARRAERSGVIVELEVWDGMVHVWQALARVLPEARRALARVGAFLESAWQDRMISSGPAR